ncbi:MAG: DUF2339 domain-containing protein [Nanoarchaeota archaeon]
MFALIILGEFIDYPLRIAWIFGGFCILFALLSRKDSWELSDQALAISLVFFLKVLIFDSWHNDTLAGGMPVRAATFLIAICVAYAISVIAAKSPHQLRVSNSLSIFYSYAGTLLAFILIILEMKEFLISVGWSILALVVMVLGFMFRQKHLRLQGMFIFGITILKVFLYDTRSLDTLYRTLSYIVLGILLLSISYVYARHKEKLTKII